LLKLSWAYPLSILAEVQILTPIGYYFYYQQKGFIKLLTEIYFDSTLNPQQKN